MENQNTAPADANLSDAEKAKALAKAMDIDNLGRAWFEPGDEKAGPALEKADAIAKYNDLAVRANWNTDEAPPANYALVTMPQMVTKKKADGTGEQVPAGLYIGAIPTPEAIAAFSAEGAAWCRDKLKEAILNRFANGVRIKDGKQPDSAPFSIADFITAAGRDTSLAYFRKVAAAYIKMLKDKKISPIPSVDTLRDVLSSKAAALQFYPKVSQSNWEKILDKMLADAKTAAIDPGLVAVWRTTRDTAEVDAGDFDLEGLESLDVSA